MCVAIPGKVVSVDTDTATVDFNGNKVNALTGVVQVKVGQYVLVHAGCIIQTMQQSEAEELINLMKEVNGDVD
jgi:hydrogenase expression/formation protein HypC